MPSTSLKKMVMLLNQSTATVLRLLKSRPYDFLVLAAIIVYGVVFSNFTILKHEVFQTSAWDLGVFDQVLYTTLYNGKFFYYTADLFLNPSGCYFAQHISPILFLVLPFYALNSSPITLLVLKSFILAFGALPLYWISRELLESAKAGFMIASIYLLYAPLHGANWFDFQPQVFLPLLFFLMFYFAVKSKWKLYFFTTVLAAMVEEHIAIFIFLVATYLLITSKVRPFLQSLKSFRKMNRNLASVITMVFSWLYFYVAWCIKESFPINPQLMPIYKAVEVFSVLGVKTDPLFFPLQVLFNPQRAFVALSYDFPLKFLFLVFLFGPLLFFSFKSKLVFATFPFLALFLFSNYRGYYSVGAHYPLYIMAFIFIAALFVLKRLEHRARISILRTMFIVSLLFTISISPLSPMSASFVNEGFLWYPGTNLELNERTASLTDLINTIPPNSSVLTQNELFPHVSNRLNAYVLPFSNVLNDTEYIRFLMNSSEYILLDLTWGQDFNTNFVLDEITNNKSYGAYALASRAILFKRGFQGEPLFANYTNFGVLSAYKDFLLASFSQIISDSTAISEKVVLCPKNSTGHFMFGPHTYLLPGSYEVTFTVKARENTESLIGECEISSNYGNSIISQRDFFGFELEPNKWTNFTLSFNSIKLVRGVEFRAFSYGTVDISIDRVIVKRLSPNASSNFGLRTIGSSDLTLISGSVSEEGFLIFHQNTTSACFWCGPYMSIPAGKYRVTFLLKISPSPQKPDDRVLRLSVSTNFGKDVLIEYEVEASDFLNYDKALDWRNFTLEFTAYDDLENVEFRGLYPQSNLKIYLGYVLVEKPTLSQNLNYEIFSVSKNLRIQDGQIVSDTSSYNGRVALSRKGLDEGTLAYGPYITLPSGTFKAVFRIKTYETSQNATVGFEVTSQHGTLILSKATLNSSELHDGSWFNVTLTFSLEVLTSNIEFRVSSNGMTNLYADTVTLLYSNDAE